ncbi:MAG TPA: 1-phosphofructokinase family hexose kinase [Clostridiaceae bacterium]|nr:1-phosphofructokinase family hexose kinase [Clostridiaceae bacterium]
MITALSLSPAVDKIYFIDGFETGKLYRVRNIVKSAGGKGINVARVCSILGEKVNLVGFKAGETGEWLESQLKRMGVNTCFIEVEGESRTNINIIDNVKNLETEVLEIGPTIRREDIESFMDEFEKVLKDTAVLVCSGGLPEGIPVNFYRILIEKAKFYGTKTILDSSGEMLSEGIKAAPYMVKPNLRELGVYAGKKLDNISDIIEACKSIINAGVEIVVTSMGAQGALLVSKDEIMRAKVPDIEVVNTIGSGDSTVAGCAAGIIRGYSLEKTLRLGMACAVANTQFKEIGYISMELVDKFFNEILVERL